jgi:hypothetical protein
VSGLGCEPSSRHLHRRFDTDPGLAIWRVPLKGTPARLTDLIVGTHPDSVTFSPDGRYAAFFRADSPAMVTHYGWFVTALTPEAGPLATSGSAYLFWQNLHWSPAGAPYAINEGTLFPLCPDPAQDAEICGEGKRLGDQLSEIRWIDGNRFLLLTSEPYDLYFGTLDGTSIDLLRANGSPLAMTCRNDSASGEDSRRTCRS